MSKDASGLLGALLSSGGRVRAFEVGPEEPGEGEGLSDLQVLTRLREVAALTAERHSFVPGQVIRHKFPSLTPFAGGAKPHIFRRYLESPLRAQDYITEIGDLGSGLAPVVLDCVVLGMSRSEEAVCEWFQASADWEPHPDYPLPS